MSDSVEEAMLPLSSLAHCCNTRATQYLWDSVLAINCIHEG